MLALRLQSVADLVADRWQGVPEFEGLARITVSGEAGVDRVFAETNRSLLAVGASAIAANVDHSTRG